MSSTLVGPRSSSRSRAIDANTEHELISAAQAGDQLAFETLVKRHHRQIFALALRYTHVREDAEDIVQQTFQKAFISLGKFERRSSFATWLTRVAINEALIFLRKGRRRREIVIEGGARDEEATITEIADGRPDPEVNCLQQEVAEILSEAVGRLKPGMRSALELYELGELTARETARCMGLSISAVKARVFQARKKLRRTLREYASSYRTPAMKAVRSASRDHLCNEWC